MRILVKYYGRLVDCTKIEKEIKEMPLGDRLSTLLDDIHAAYPCIKDQVQTVFLNKQKVAARNIELKEWDEVLFMPAYSGG